MSSGPTTANWEDHGMGPIGQNQCTAGTSLGSVNFDPKTCNCISLATNLMHLHVYWLYTDHCDRGAKMDVVLSAAANQTKSQCIWLGTRQLRSNIDEYNMIKFQFPDWNPQFVVRSLGVLLDWDLSKQNEWTNKMADHVNSQSVSAAETLAHSLILTRLNW